MDDRWLSVEEIVSYLGVSRDTIYAWIAGRGLPAHRVGRLWKLKKDAVDRAVPKQTGPLMRSKGVRTSIDLSLAADRSGLFAAWPALANLADMAGKITVAVRAESASGLDKHALEHAVLEPLRELGLIDEDGKS